MPAMGDDVNTDRGHGPLYDNCGQLGYASMRSMASIIVGLRSRFYALQVNPTDQCFMPQSPRTFYCFATLTSHPD